MKEAEHEELDLSPWQTVGAVTARILLQLTPCSLVERVGEKQIDVQPKEKDDLPECGHVDAP